MTGIYDEMKERAEKAESTIEELKLKINQRDNAISAQEKVLASRDIKIIQLEKSIEAALSIAKSNGQTDGAHHKMWAIDQMVKALINDKDKYFNWVQNYCDSVDVWDKGIPP